MAINIDMKKAFDFMEWSFLLNILKCLGFHPKWIKRIEECITTVSFSVVINGEPVGKFSPSRGLRQRDPISAFLFILGIEALSRLINREENLGR